MITPILPPNTFHDTHIKNLLFTNFQVTKIHSGSKYHLCLIFSKQIKNCFRRKIIQLKNQTSMEIGRTRMEILTACNCNKKYKIISLDRN